MRLTCTLRFNMVEQFRLELHDADTVAPAVCSAHSLCHTLPCFTQVEVFKHTLVSLLSVLSPEICRVLSLIM